MEVVKDHLRLQLETDFDTTGKQLLEQQPASVLKILVLAQHPFEIRGFLGKVLKLQTLKEYRLMMEICPRAVITEDTSETGGKLLICESPGTVSSLFFAKDFC